MQNLSIGIPLQHDIGDRDLNLPSEQVDPAPHPRNNAQLNFGSEIQRHLGNWSNTWGAPPREVSGSEMVEPEDARDAAGAIINGETEEFAGFEIPSDDDPDRLGAWEANPFTEEGGWVCLVGRKREKIEG